MAGFTALAVVAVVGAAAGAAGPEGVSGPWPSDVPGWKPIQPGEHPRLVFRKSELPALRKKAETPVGKAIIARMQKLLAEQAYSTWHAAACAFLWQVTEEAKYAEQAEEFALRTVQGKGPNPDGRYTWPGKGQLRAGPCLWGVALAYDLAYDTWSPEVRKQVAEGIVANPHVAGIANNPSHGPGCNHWGAHTGGLGCALLALRGDPEVEAALIEAYLAKVVHNAKREIVEGYGRRGYYYEGHHCGRISSNTGLIPFIQAYRVAAGKDLVANCENAQWLAAKWIYDLFAQPDGTPGSLQRGMYARAFERGKGLSANGDFAEGFGIVPDSGKAALLWTYNHVVCPGPDKDYDVLETPMHGVYALANWPIDLAEQNPGEVLPLVLHDRAPNYFVFRDGWKGDGSDLVVTAMMGSRPTAGRGMAAGTSVFVGGRGLHAGKETHYRFPGVFFTCQATYTRFAEDGSGVVSGAVAEDTTVTKGRPSPAIALGLRPTSLAVDFSGASGSDLLVAMTGPQIGHTVGYWMQLTPMAKPVEATGADGWQTHTVRLDPKGNGLSQPWYLMTLHQGKPVPVAADGGVIRVGKQTLTFDGEKIILGTMAKEAAPASLPKP